MIISSSCSFYQKGKTNLDFTEASDTTIRAHYVLTTTMTHTHTRLTALCPGLPGWAGTRKVKPIWILLKQETVSGCGISWAICKSAPRSRQITMPAPHCSVFFTGRMPFLPPNQQRQSTEDKTMTHTAGLFSMATGCWCHESMGALMYANFNAAFKFAAGFDLCIRHDCILHRFTVCRIVLKR